MSLGLSLIIPCAKLAADGDFDWFKDDFNTASFKGTAVLADGNTAPYTFEVYKYGINGKAV